MDERGCLMGALLTAAMALCGPMTILMIEKSSKEEMALMGIAFAVLVMLPIILWLLSIARSEAERRQDELSQAQHERELWKIRNDR